MKIIYNSIIVFCLCMVLICSAYAQSSRTLARWGTTTELKNKIRDFSNTSLRRESNPVLALKVSSEKTLNAKINYIVATTGKESMSGTIDGSMSSDFHIKITNGKVRGEIILRDTKKAYRIYSDQKANVMIEETAIDSVICTGFAAAAVSEPWVNNTPPPTDPVFSLQSFPNATACAYLDFDGAMVESPYYNGGKPFNNLPSGMPADSIRKVWEIVKEDFMPFNINITTSEAVFNSYPMRMRVRCIITPTTTAAPGYGGYAMIGSFLESEDTPCFAFLTSTTKPCGDVTSHEFGHVFSLYHDGQVGGIVQYFSGHFNWGTIMGNSYSREIAQWSKGEYEYANNNYQDDVAIIGGNDNGFFFRQDDYASDFVNAKKLPINPLSIYSIQQQSGIIETASDVDMFVFDLKYDAVLNLFVNPSAISPNLDIKVKMYDKDQNLIGLFDTTGLNVTIKKRLSPGKYYFAVDGAGYGDPKYDGYTDYGSLGYYTISGNILVAPTIILRSPKAGQVINDPSSLEIKSDIYDLDNNITKVEFFDGEKKIGETVNDGRYVWENVFPGTHTFTVKATDATGVQASASVTVSVVSPYCFSRGLNSGTDYINSIQLNNNIVSTGNDNGYGNYTESNIGLTRGNAYTLVVNGYTTRKIYGEAFFVWIDFNQNGQFNDENEMVAYGLSTWTNPFTTNRQAIVYLPINIPLNAPLDKTRMRIAMKYNGIPGSCEQISYGEVEDYTVRILGPFSSREGDSSEEIPMYSGEQLSVYPNPAEQMISFSLNNYKEAEEISVVNGLGQVMLETDLNNQSGTINISALPSGIYILKVKFQGREMTKKFVKL